MAREGAISENLTPDWLPLGTNQVSALPEGCTVLAMWSGDEGARQYIVHRESGRIYARTQSDVTAGLIDRDKVLTFVTRVWLPPL